MTAKAFVQECRAISCMYETAPPDQREFVAGEVACVLHVAPSTGTSRLVTALELVEHPSEALGRLVDLRDVTSALPGDSTPARLTERDHRLPYPLGATDADDLQNVRKHWHRAEHSGWHTRSLPDGTVRWRSAAAASTTADPSGRRHPRSRPTGR